MYNKEKEKRNVQPPRMRSPYLSLMGDNGREDLRVNRGVQLERSDEVELGAELEEELDDGLANGDISRGFEVDAEETQGGSREAAQVSLDPGLNDKKKGAERDLDEEGEEAGG